MFAAAAKRTPRVSLTLLALLALSIVGASAAAPPDKDRQAPSAPQNLRVLSATQDSVTLAWDVSQDDVAVVGYHVYGDRGKATVDQDLAKPAYTVTGLKCGQSVQLTVLAFDEAQNRSERATAIVSAAACVDMVAPTTPEGFTQLATSDSAVVLAWNPSRDDVGVVGYGVYRNLERVASPSEPSAPLAGLACGTTYEYSVDAVDAAGNRSRLGRAFVRTNSCSTPPPPPPSDTQAPSTPTGLAASNIGQTGLTLTWNASADNVGVAGYDVYRDGVKVSSPTATSASLSGLTCATSYAFGVQARDAAGNTSQRAQLNVATAACSSTPPPPPPSDTQPPSTPGSLRVSSASGSSVSLAWNPSSDNVGVAGYRTYRNGTLVSSGAQTSSTVSGLACGSGYTFEVSAFDAAGNASARASVTGSTLACPDVDPPSAPANVVASSRTATSIALTWSAAFDDVGVTGYRLYRGGAAVGTTPGTTWIFSGLVCGTGYTLAVDAYDAAGNRSAQTVVMVSTTACPDTTPPSAPTGLAASNVTQTGLTLTWNPSIDNVGVAGYDVYRNGTKTATVSSTSSGQTGLTCGTTYSLGVIARDAAGNSSGQATLQVSTPACSPPAPPALAPSKTFTRKSDFGYFFNGQGASDVSTPCGDGVRFVADTTTPAPWESASKISQGAELDSRVTHPQAGDRTLWTWYIRFPSADNSSGFDTGWWGHNVLIEFGTTGGSVGHEFVMNTDGRLAFYLREGPTQFPVRKYATAQPVPLDTCIPVEMEIKWSYGSDGLFRGKIGGVELVNRSGPTMWNGEVIRHLGIGWYSPRIHRNAVEYARMQYTLLP